MKRTIISLSLTLLVISGFAQSALELSSSDARLNESFAWAKKTALSYTRTGDKVGLWYEAALPDRESFCMRDVSHMSTGAYFLGLNDYNKNMFEKFAQYIAPSRDWCSYWEINKNDKPTPCDYTSDADFFYTLNANFDVMFACSNMYRLSGDKDYMFAKPFYNFHKLSVTEYPKTWDTDKDGNMDGPSKNGSRGRGSYYETLGDHIFCGADLLGAQAKGYEIYANLLKLQNKKDSAVIYFAMADKIRTDFDSQWWNAEKNVFYSYKSDDGKFGSHYINGILFFTLHFDLVTDKAKIEKSLNTLIARGENVEENSYMPMLFYKYDKLETAYQRLLYMVDPSVERRTYPEVSYSFVGSVAEGLMGLELNAPENRMQTTPKLPKDLGWVELKNIPWKDGRITVKHNGTQSTTLTSNAKQIFTWRAKLPGNSKMLLVNGKSVKAKSSTNFNGESMVYVDVAVKPNASITVSKAK